MGVAVPTSNSESEARIVNLVARFYELGRADPVLGPLFDAAIPNYPEHMAIVADFWSRHLLGTERYRGNVFASHMRLPIEPVHFDLWLKTFKQAADETLTPMLAQQAMAKAAHMTQSITVGLFPYRDAEGKPTRKPPF
ncbi:globin family protein [Paramagnetospirillum kuznetsovii]|uniref:Globin family protein n=1 Tax=Paramagnetospirillum kuznetsovii TaxID=2053833 RepID=A0A364NZ81_9PROT|nr:globin family protein [Paramagnetospirillum kuznetsovii]